MMGDIFDILTKLLTSGAKNIIRESDGLCGLHLGDDKGDWPRKGREGSGEMKNIYSSFVCTVQPLEFRDLRESTSYNIVITNIVNV